MRRVGEQFVQRLRLWIRLWRGFHRVQGGTKPPCRASASAPRRQPGADVPANQANHRRTSRVIFSPSYRILPLKPPVRRRPDIMNTNAVRETFRLLPADSVAYRANPPILGRKPVNQTMAAHPRLAEMMNDPQWAWRIAQAYYLSQEPLPAALRDLNVRRAYFYLRGARDEPVAVAHGIRTSLAYGNTRAVLQGLLCAPDISIEGIASWLGLAPEVVRLFEGLFFNVRGRAAAFAMNQIFPQSRIGAVAEAEKGYDEVDLMLMRVGRDYGWKEVARLAGLIPLEDATESPDTLLADMEKTIAANARMLTRAGHLNRKDSPGIRQGKALMLRPKPEAARQQTDDDRVGLGSFGMRAAVLEHFRRISEPDTQYRLALQRRQLMDAQDAQTQKPHAQA